MLDKQIFLFAIIAVVVFGCNFCVVLRTDKLHATRPNCRTDKKCHGKNLLLTYFQREMSEIYVASTSNIQVHYFKVQFK